MGKGRIAGLLVVLAALIAAPAARATITVGSDLSAPIDSGVGGDITLFLSAPARLVTTSPVAGTVVGGNVKQNTTITPGWGTASLRVVHPVAGGQYQVLSAGPPNVIPTGIGDFPVAAHLPIAKGDLVAIQATGSLNRAITAGSTYLWDITSLWPPGGPPRTLNPGFTDSEILYNAQIDPTNTFTLGTPTILKKGKATVVVTVPNPGAVSAGASNDSGFAANAKKKKKPGPLLLRASAAAPDAGPLTLTLSASKAGKKLLKQKGKLKVTARIVYTPTGGSAGSQTIQLKLKS